MNFNIYKYKTWCFLCISGLLSTIFGPLPYLQGCIDFAPYQGGTYLINLENLIKFRDFKNEKWRLNSRKFP